MIRGKHISLRTVRESDFEHLFERWSDVANRGDHYPVKLPSQIDFRRRFQEHGLWEETSGTLLIWADEQIVGLIAFFPAMYYSGFEIGYIMFDVASRGKGYMTEALALLTRFLFGTKKINRLQLTVMPGNVASKRVAEKCGFQAEGIMRGAIFHRGTHHDVEMFSLLRHEVDEL
ncbi:MAG: GNAT family N-acetyltransferase [Chloroflexi bacterium]|nr:GNAT family N-acetyltransferase [Chloroflexota bacterium]